MIVFTEWNQVADSLDGYTVPARMLSDIARVEKEHKVSLAPCFSRGQLYSKLWLMDRADGFFRVHHNERITVCGSWYGQLVYLLLHKFGDNKVQALDCDDAAVEVSDQLNVCWSNYESVCMDMLDYEYDNTNIVVNTSCEHVGRLSEWRRRLKPGTLVVAQSNNNTSIPEHVHCARSLEHFQQQLNLTSVMLAEEVKFPDYSRYMVIGAS